MKKRLKHWVQAPVVVPRWFLTMKYASFMVLGVLAFQGGIQTIDLVTSPVYTVAWSGALTLSALVGVVTSFQAKTENAEKWAAVALASLLLTWGAFSIYRATTEGDSGRLTGAWMVLICAGLPLVRALGLMRASGK